MSRRERQRRRQRNKGGPAKVLFLVLGLVFTAVAIAGIAAVAWVINVANGAPSLDTKKPIELYDVKTDSAEAHDVATQHSEVVKRFEEYLKAGRTDSKLWPIRENVGRNAAGQSANSAEESSK